MILATLLHFILPDDAPLADLWKGVGNNKTEGAMDPYREKMMVEFLRLLGKKYEGSIPSGIIFLPTKRLSVRGYGWAPTTWANPICEDYPYPLRWTTRPTEIWSDGLLVEYPGILLLSETMDTILSASPVSGFSFPVDRDLNEWYRVVGIITEEEAPETDTVKAGQGRKPAGLGLALIIPRTHPRHRPGDIGLLVEVYKRETMLRQDEPSLGPILYARIIRRVKISRGASELVRAPCSQVIGERTNDNQLWCVDGYDAHSAELNEQKTNKANGKPLDVDTKAKIRATLKAAQAAIQPGKLLDKLSFRRSPGGSSSMLPWGTGR